MQADEGSTLKESIMIPLKSTTAGILKVTHYSLCYFYCTAVLSVVERVVRVPVLCLSLRKTKRLPRFCVFLDAAFCRRMC